MTERTPGAPDGEPSFGAGAPQVPTVAMVHLGLPSSLGATRRVRNLRDMFLAAGADVVDVPLLTDHRAGLTDAFHVPLGALAAGRIVPESLAWSHRRAVDRLHQVGADVVVCSTARSFHPSLVGGPWTVVIDYVDRLSDSYRDRAQIIGPGPKAALFRILARAANRFERRPLPDGVLGIAAGSADAEAMGLQWVPLIVDLPELGERATPTHDLLLFGKLSYAPNVESVERLDRVWPQIQAARPGTTLVLAGAAPSDGVLALARRRGWTVVADFADLAEIATLARVATAPLTYASGMQGKVLEAAAYGLPQVISTAVARGFGGTLPSMVVESDHELVDALVSLLDDPAEQVALGRAAREHVAQGYTVERWTPWARNVIAEASGRRPLA